MERRDAIFCLSPLQVPGTSRTASTYTKYSVEFWNSSTSKMLVTLSPHMLYLFWYTEKVAVAGYVKEEKISAYISES